MIRTPLFSSACYLLLAGNVFSRSAARRHFVNPLRTGLFPLCFNKLLNFAFRMLLVLLRFFSTLGRELLLPLAFLGFALFSTCLARFLSTYRRRLSFSRVDRMIVTHRVTISPSPCRVMKPDSSAAYSPWLHLAFPFFSHLSTMNPFSLSQ